MFHALTDWFAAHNLVFTDPYAAAIVLGALAGSLFDWIVGRVVPWLRFHLRRPVTLGSWLVWPFSDAARRRYRLLTSGKDLDRLIGLAGTVNDDISKLIARLDRLGEEENAARWPLEPVR